jgi:arsenate reductase
MNHTREKIVNVLFICTHNSARSVLAEGLMNGLGKGRLVGHSAGSTPSGRVNPWALSTLERMGLPASGYRSKDWSEFEGPGAPPMDFIITVCDNAAGEVCPVWPGKPATAHWGVADPAACKGSDADKAQAFWDTALILKRRIELLLALPLSTLDAAALQHAIRGIGAPAP